MKTTIIAHLDSWHSWIRVNNRRAEMDLCVDLHGFFSATRYRKLLAGCIPLPVIKHLPNCTLDAQDSQEAKKLFRDHFYHTLDNVEATYLPGLEREDGSEK